ncbi:hypothetical protein [Pseudomonas boanensis]|uniref:hypothetical protein n=1 Tax=Metapseudomonas boanensis TaxID=2822138 RepID=UPI0035D4F673
MKVGTLGKLLKQALKEVGVEPPLPSPTFPQGSPGTDQETSPNAKSSTSADSPTDEGYRSAPSDKKRTPSSPGRQSRARSGQGRTAPARQQVEKSPPVKQPVPAPPYSLKMGPEVSLIWCPSNANPVPALAEFAWTGRALQLAENASEDAELTIGLDFGTSSVKAVITDKAKNISYAVPFRDGVGVGSYLLPSTLKKGEQQIHDLKMALLSNPGSQHCQENVVEFLARVIRHVRGWLFVTHGKVYQRSYILWGLSIGLPVASMREKPIVELYKVLGYAAWLAAGSSELVISRETIWNALERAKQLDPGSDEAIDEAGVEIALAPEVAAQIHGFVSSGAYDPHGQNIFLMVDIGAGTLDASVFRIERQGGRDRFIAFSATVEPNGVMCWHRRRMQWWQQALESNAPERADLLEGIQRIALDTGTESPVPDELTGYFNGLDVQFCDQSAHPDRVFYRKASEQVGYQTYARLKIDHLLPEHQMAGMPMILCGGGKRLPFYSKLERSMSRSSGYPWFGTRPFPLQKPARLRAPGLKAAEYDRLSVAYGLSRINLKEVVTDVPPMISSESVVNWRDLYIEN